MELIIKIPEEQYNDIVKHLTDNDGNYAYSDFNLREIIRNGIPYNPSGDCISRNAVIRMFNTMDRYKADKLILQDTDKEFPKNEVFIVDDCYEQLDLIDNAPPVPQVTVFAENADEKAVADLKTELQSVIEARPQGEQIAWEQGYEAGLAQGKHESKKGEWARHDEWRGGEYIGGFYHVNCPCEDGYYSKWETNFCPNCGLPMKKGGAE